MGDHDSLPMGCIGFLFIFPSLGAWPPRLLFGGGSGGFRLTSIGSVDGGLELLVGFWSRRAFRSWTCCLNSLICRSGPSMTAPYDGAGLVGKTVPDVWGD